MKKKTDLCNRLKTRTLECLMRISIEGPSREDFDFAKTAKMWMKNRRLLSYNKNPVKRTEDTD